MTWLWWAPFGAATLHIIEEFGFPGGFPAWDRSYRPAIRASITRRLHVVVNAALLLLCLQVGLFAGAADPDARAMGATAWLAVSALLLSNAVFHVVGTVRTRSYSPGVITALSLYVPMAVFGYWRFLDGRVVSPLIAGGAAAVGGSYHFWAGWLHRLRARREPAQAHHPAAPEPRR